MLVIPHLKCVEFRNSKKYVAVEWSVFLRRPVWTWKIARDVLQ